ncbi:hypothetical protein A1Q2_08072 [Trichosporon asahii var. asahii CBS 8904]|uniref:Uncharacterized protein n=1 Tax=Trichosporon asahii var. asahii (strain CBS 8904) TaxID=1220162 RepID=K1W7I8_TRIAC|nr:hypothetical protein A1Q2_08072 [Trichosporon asahii var. asahii CBS 8904]
MLTNFRFFAALCLFLGLQALAFRITSPARDAQWKTGNRETVSWEDGPSGKLIFQLQVVNKAQFIYYDIFSGDFGAGNGQFAYKPTTKDAQTAEWAGTYLRVIDGSGKELAVSERFDIKL